MNNEIRELSDQLGYLIPNTPNDEKKDKDKSYYPFDSDLEQYFSWWLKELKEEGFIDDYEYQIEKFLLSSKDQFIWTKQLVTKTKEQTRELIKGHHYTPDFKIIWNNRAEGILYTNIDNPKLSYPDAYFKAQYRDGLIVSTIDVKPPHDFENMTRLFTINQKWVLQNFGIYVQKITPVGGAKVKKHLFKDTFMPKRYETTRTGRKRKIHFNPKYIKDLS